MLYTGGTTGLPKGVMFHQADSCRSLLGFRDVWSRIAIATTTEDIKALVLELHAGDPVVTSRAVL